MKWEVTAYTSGDGITLVLTSRQSVSVSTYKAMDFIIRPIGDEGGPREKWKLRLILLDGENSVAIEDFTYNSLTEATTDAEALAAYLQSTTDAPHISPDSVPTQLPTFRTVRD